MRLSPNEIRDITTLLEKGQPLPEKYRFLLFGDNREVELVWNGKTDEITNVALPFQVIEQIDEPRSEKEIKFQNSLFDTSGRQISGWTNKLIWGDNKLILSSLKNGPMRREIEAQGGIKLIYIDPPFDVGADFSMNIEIGEEEFTKKPSVIEDIAYRDTWGKGADSFVSMIYERLKLMHDLLAADGTIYVHCDYRVNSYMRLVLDEIFGKKNFRNEIIWCYTSASNPGKDFPKKHDTILRYSKSEKYTFNNDAIRVDYDEKTKANYKEGLQGSGTFYEGKIKDTTGVLKDGKIPEDWWEFAISARYPIDGIKRTGYPTEKTLPLLERIIKASSNEGDLIADFFVGSGTTLAVAEKLGRKWIGTDIGRFGVHTSRKRMIEVQRQLKKNGKNYRAFEILNLGVYERKRFAGVDGDLRAEQRQQVQLQKEREFVALILQAYKAEPIDSFVNFVGKKRDRLVAVGPIEFPVTRTFVESIIKECKEKGVSKADVLGFDYEMGIDFSEAKKQGVDVQFKVIPREVFDKRAVEKGQVKFFDVAFIEVTPIIKAKSVSIELKDFSVFYNQDDLASSEEDLKPGRSKIVIEAGKVIKISKEKDTEIIHREVLTKKWTDWIDYWSVDFNFESKKEIIRMPKNARFFGEAVARQVAGATKGDETGVEFEEVWTGQYIFENEWQSFRTKKDRQLELVSAAHEMPKGIHKIAIKVIDIFGNDTTKVIEIKV